MVRSLIALGANLGDRRGSLEQAVEWIGAEPQIALVASSGWHETSAIGGPSDQGSFLNGAVVVETTLAPARLHEVLVRIEGRLGRTRGTRWAARTADLDLLLYGEEVIDTPTLVVPHPRMAFRRFVLEPAAEVAPDLVHPTIGWSVRELLNHLNTALPYVAALGLPGSGKTSLAGSLSRTLGGRLLAEPATPPPLTGLSNYPGHLYERQIQFLDRRADVLQSRAFSADKAPVFSDFYFDQSLAYAQTELDAGMHDSFIRAWEASRARVMQPKLLVVLDESPAVAAPELAARQAIESPTERLRRKLLDLAARRGIGPVLYAGSREEPARSDEILAAIAAMH